MKHIVVIGAGVIGSALTLRVAQRGIRVTLVDAGSPGESTSGRSFAWLNANAKTPRAYFALNLCGMRAHRALAAELGGTWYWPVGNLEWAVTDELPARVERLRSWGYAARCISWAEAGVLEPALRAPEAPEEDASWLAFFPEEGFVLSRQLIDRLVAVAQEHGATVVTHEPVVGFDLQGGRIAAARLGSGERLHADVFVCCAGWQTARLAALAGVSVPLIAPEYPQSPAPALVVHTGPASFEVRRVLHTPDVDVRPAEDGRLLLEAADIDHVAHARVSTDQMMAAATELLHRAHRILPARRTMALEHAQVCIRPLPLDGYPIVGWVREVGSCYIMVTHSGITLAPYLALLAAGELCNDELAPALTPYRPDRFVTSGSLSTPQLLNGQ
jgi:glycine/D-amino acid oxidase-like deaminating enzyme